MNQSVVKADDANVIFQQWRFQETVEVESRKRELREEKRTFEKERRSFERERREFSVQKKIEDRRIEKEKQLFDMKWKILEEELRKLVSEKQQVEKQRDFYRYVSAYESHVTKAEEPEIVSGELFFVGVENEQSLKKRYKDLIKIYHPDNLDGDTATIQEINREYHKLKKIYE